VRARAPVSSPRRHAARYGDFALATAGALVYGTTIVFSRIVAKNGLGPVTALAVRFGVAGSLLVAMLVVLRRPVLPPRGERVRAALLGTVYASESSCFFIALEHGTTAAVALLFYVYPAVVAAAEMAIGALAPRRSTFAAIVLSTSGAIVVAVGGGSVSISPIGIAFAMAAVVCFSTYALASARLIPRTDALTSAAWTAIGASSTMLVVGVCTGSLRGLGASTAPLLANGLATASAFTLFFVAIGRLGASRTSVVMTLEAAFAVVLAALFLGEGLRVLEVAGGVVVLAGAAIAGLVNPSARDELVVGDPP
jgi:drug/metabolite transporter (DMT)-like permease